MVKGFHRRRNVPNKGAGGQGNGRRVQYRGRPGQGFSANHLPAMEMRRTIMNKHVGYRIFFWGGGGGGGGGGRAGGGAESSVAAVDRLEEVKDGQLTPE